MRFVLAVFLMLFIITSCGKRRTIHIKAVNAATGQSYAGLEYRVASSRTAANGEKYRSEEALPAGTYVVYVVQVWLGTGMEVYKLVVL